MCLSKHHTNNYGYEQIGVEGKCETDDQGVNISFLISVCEQGLGLALSKDGGTKQWSLGMFFKELNSHLNVFDYY